MNIIEYADTINAHLDIIYHHNQNGRYSASFERSGIAQGCGKLGTYGDGRNPEEAVVNYINIIKGQELILMHNTDYERRMIVPTKLQFDGWE